MNKRSLILLSIFFILLVANVYAQNVLENVLDAIAGETFNITEIYNKYGMFIDLVIYLLIFLGISRMALGEKFKHNQAVVIGIGLVLAISLSYWGQKNGFTIAAFGPFAGAVFALLIFVAIYELLKTILHTSTLGDKGKAAIISFVVVWYMLQAVTPAVLDWIVVIPVIGPLLKGVVGVCLIIAIYFIARMIISVIKGEPKSVPSTPPITPTTRTGEAAKQITGKGKLPAFFNILKIDEKTKFKRNLEKERILYNEFVKACEEKNTFVKNFLNLWNEISLKNLRKVKQQYKSLIDKNERIIKILDRIIARGEITSSLFYKLVIHQEKVHNQLSNLGDGEEVAKKIEIYISRVDEELNFLKKYLKEENKYVKDNDIWRTHKDLAEEHGKFYRLIEGENTVFNNIKVHILNLLRFLQFVEKPSDTIKKKLERLRIVPVRYNNQEFRDFFNNIYLKKFKDEEMENIDVFDYSFKDHKKYSDDYAWLILLAKIDNEVVGGIISEILSHKISDNMLKFYKKEFNTEIKNQELGYGVVWWIAVKEENQVLRKGIGTLLANVALNNLEKEADSMGLELLCVLAEIDPNKREIVNLAKKLGMAEIFKEYIQITADKRHAQHLSLYIWAPFKDISKDKLLIMIEGLQIQSNELKPSELKKFPPYLKMVKDILEKPL